MQDNPIGIFDSGFGGLTVLAEAKKLLPNEDFVYFCDQKNVPYGNKKPAQIKEFVQAGVEFLISENVKAIVIACNTATSASIDDLRANFSIPIIGMEPAIKPAIEQKGGGRVLVLATSLTLSEEKFKKLEEKLDAEKDTTVIPIDDLAVLIEKHLRANSNCFIYSEEIEECLKKALLDIDLSRVAVVVLGCTHHIFVRPYLEKILPPHIDVIDGNLGTVRQLERILVDKGLLENDDVPGGEMKFFSSDSSIIDIDKICRGILENYL